MLTLIRTLEGEQGTIFQLYEGRRIKLAECTVRIQLYEDAQKVPVLGGSGIKKYKIGIILCGDINDVVLKGIPEITTDILNQQGIYERFYLNDIAFTGADDMIGEWQFELRDQEQIKKLFSI